MAREETIVSTAQDGDRRRELYQREDSSERPVTAKCKAKGRSRCFPAGNTDRTTLPPCQVPPAWPAQP